MHSSNHTEHYLDKLYSHAQNKTALEPNVLIGGKNWNTSVIGHKQGTVGFPKAQTTAKVNCKLVSQYQ